MAALLFMHRSEGHILWAVWKKDETYTRTKRSPNPDKSPGEVLGLTMTFQSKLQTRPKGVVVTGSPHNTMARVQTPRWVEKVKKKTKKTLTAKSMQISNGLIFQEPTGMQGLNMIATTNMYLVIQFRLTIRPTSVFKKYQFYCQLILVFFVVILFLLWFSPPFMPRKQS